MDDERKQAEAFSGPLADRSRRVPARRSIPVCGMSVDPATAEAKADYDGRTFYFCCDGCKETFLTEPAKYAAPTPKAAETVVDPVCGMSIDKATAKYGAIRAGRRFQFCSAACKTKFVAEPEKFIALAPGGKPRRPPRRRAKSAIPLRDVGRSGDRQSEGDA